MKKNLLEYRLIAAVALLLIPIALLGYFFVQQSNNDIRFATKELTGVDYLRAVMPALAAITTGDDTLRSTSLESFAKASEEHGRNLNTTALAQTLTLALQAQGAPSVAARDQAIDLIGRIADQSNLILDPDLDSYYVMDIVALRLPEIMRLEAELRDLSAQAQRGSPYHTTMAAQKAQLVIGLLNAEFGKLKTSLQKAVESNFAVASKLEKPTQDHLANSKKSWSIFTRRLAAEQNSNDLTMLAAQTHLDLANKNLTYWSSVADVLQELLAARIQTLENRLYSALGISAFATLLALGFAIRVLQRLLSGLDEKIIYLAHHDPMTRLKNRATFNIETKTIIENASSTGEQLALHLVDLDHFKAINDKHGHQSGDAVLKAVSERLVKSSRPGDIVARLGGDEFVVLQRNISGEADAAAFSQRLVSSMREPILHDGNRIDGTLTIGYATYPHHARSVDDLSHAADLALFYAKSLGRNQAHVFTQDLQNQIVKRKQLEQEVLTALAENRLFLNFQPLFDPTGRKLNGFEALLRLRGSDGSIIPPNTFIPVAEELNLISEIGAWVLTNAAISAAAWPKSLYLAVNLSPLQFKSGSVSKAIDNALHTSGLDPKRLEVEITEGILMDQSQKVMDELQAVRRLGVSIAMDDFGTGFSSLSYLWRFRFDKLKIDRSFMKAYDNDRNNASNILKTIVMLGHALGMTVTAEGVETDAQANFLQSLNCDEIQGFLYGKPISEDEIPALLMTMFRDQIETQKLLKILAPEKAQELDQFFTPSRTSL
jgi:diguanylate cyclase (GGDEF)-like protein